MEELRIRGGARVGWVHVSWPLATLVASGTTLSITGWLIGSYGFRPDEVVALEPYGWFPVLGRSVHVVHTRRDYPKSITFGSFRNPENLIEDIRRTGFLPLASPTEVAVARGFPIRWSVVIGFVALWNGLFLLDGFVPWKEPEAPGPFVLLALTLLFVSSAVVRRSAYFQSLVLRPGRTVREIQPLLALIQVVGGFLLVGFTLFSIFGIPAG